MAERRVFYRVPAGRAVPIHTSHAVGAGGAALICEPAKAGERPKVYALPDVTEIRKRLRAGDLELCDRDGKAVADPVAAPDDITVDPDGTVPSERELIRRKAEEEAAKKREAEAAAKAAKTDDAKPFDVSDEKGK